MCHGCAIQENQRLGRIDAALLKLRGVKAINSLDAATALDQAGAVIADKDATIRRLKVKLEALEEVMQERDRLQKNESLPAYAEFTRDIASALGMSTHEISLKEVLEKIKDLKSTNGWRRKGQIAKVVHDIQVAALVSHRDKLQKERDSFKDLAELLAAKMPK